MLTHALQDYMEDHEATARIARAAAFIFSAPNLDATLPARPGGIPWLYHCDPLGGLDHRGRTVAPDTLVDVSAVHEEKIALLACHASQRAWLRHHHGTDEYLDQVRRHDHARGESVPCAHAEAFVQHRSHAFPADDLLARLLPHP